MPVEATVKARLKGMEPGPIPNLIGDAAPFDIDGYVNEMTASEPMEKIADTRDSLASVFGKMSRPFLAQGYGAAAALNRGLAGFSAHLDAVAKYVETSTGMKSEGLFENAAKVYEENRAYWQKRAEDVGMGFIDEIVAEAVGGFVPGVAQFSLDVATGLTFPYMDGAERAYERDESPFVGGMLEAAKTGTLAGLFRVIAPLKNYLKAPVMGTAFGIQEAEQAPEGQKARAFAKGAAIGAGYAITSPGGRMGLNEVGEAIKTEVPKAYQAYKDLGERGAVGEDQPPIVESPGPPGQMKQRKFLETVEESLSTDPTLAEAVKKVEPQDYLVQPNAQSRAMAEARIKTTGVDATIDWLKSEEPVSAEKGAAFITLIERAQKQGQYDQAVDLVEAYDVQLREAGRFVQAASLWNKLSAPAFIRWANKQLDATRQHYSWADTLLKRKPESFTLSKDEQVEIIKRMKEINGMPDGIDKQSKTLELIDFVAQKVPPSVSEMIDAYRYQNMLSGPRTHLRNIGENVFNTFLTRPVDITTRGAIDWVKAGLTGADRQAYVSDVPTYMKAAINAVPNATHAFMETLRLGPGATVTKPETGAEAKTAFERARMAQLPTSLTLVSRFMEASDKFNMALIGAGEMANQLKHGASEVEAYRKAMETAETLLYRDKLDPSDPNLSYPSKVLAGLGKMIEGSRKFPVLGTISKWYIPFIKTPINKGVQMIERSPVGAIRGDIDQEAAAKIMGGAVVTAIGAAFAYNGDTTWTAPGNEEEKAWFYASGRKPFSVRIGDTWVPIWYLGPFALAFALPAAVKHYTEDRSQAITDDGMDKLINLVNGTAQFIGSQSSTQSIGALFSALQGDADFRFSSQTGFTVEQAIPASGLIRWVNTIIDPIYRKPQGFWEGIEKDLPGLSQRLDARMTPLFEESRRETTNYFLPYDVGTVNPMYETMLPLQAYAVRSKRIESTMNKVIQDLREKKITPEESMEKIMKLMMAGPESMNKLGKDLEGRD